MSFEVSNEQVLLEALRQCGHSVGNAYKIAKSLSEPDGNFFVAYRGQEKVEVVMNTNAEFLISLSYTMEQFVGDHVKSLKLSD